MKKMLLAGLAILITCSGGAQKLLYSSTSAWEGLLKKNNKVYYIRTVIDSISLKNGVVVYPDGRIKTPNGIAYTMAAGDCIKFNGQLIVFYQWLDLVNGIKTKRHVMRLWCEIKQPMTLLNGTYAQPDGTLKLQTGALVIMKNNEFLGFDGSGVMALQ